MLFTMINFLCHRPHHMRNVFQRTFIFDRLTGEIYNQQTTIIIVVVGTTAIVL
jgi:hypothetical protein